MDFEKPSNVTPISRAFEIRKENEQQEALQEKNKQIDREYIERLIGRVHEEQKKNKDLLSEARVMVRIIGEQRAKMEEVGLLAEEQELHALELRLYQEVSLYEEFFPHI